MLTSKSYCSIDYGMTLRLHNRSNKEMGVFKYF